MKISLPIGKRLIAAVLAFAMFFSILPLGNGADAGETGAFVVGENSYDTLAEAIEAVEGESVIKMVDNYEGPGVVIDKSVTIDFGGCTYTVMSTVGSAGTETLGFQLLAPDPSNAPVINLTNGCIAAGTDEIKMLVQNYTNLTVDSMILDGSGSNQMKYVLSNNNGNVNVVGDTSILIDWEKTPTAVALDAFDYASGGYKGVKVTVNTTGTIQGAIEVSDGSADLDVLGGTFSADVEKYVVDGLVQDAAGEIGDAKVASVDGVYYKSLNEALEAAQSGGTVVLERDYHGDGVIIDKSVTIDFNNHTYTVMNTVGSAGTETLGFQLLAGDPSNPHNITLKGGTIATGTNAVKMLVQNYTNLTVDGMILDATGSDQMQYVLSNNNGNVQVIGNTNILVDFAKTPKVVAIDAYDYVSGGYQGVTVTVDTTGKIQGAVVEDGADATISIKNGTYTANVKEFVVEGRTQNAAGEIVDAKVAQIGETYYASLKEAVEAANDGDTIILQCDYIGEGIIINKDITINFNGYTYTVHSTVGSAGTETLGFQLLAGDASNPHNITLQGGTIATDTNAVKVLVQNYSNLTVTDMTLNGAGSNQMLYVLSNNNGNVNLTGNTNILVADGKENDVCAFDVFDYAAGGYKGVKVTVDTDGKIEGKIEISDGAAELLVKGGTFTATVDKKYIAPGYIQSESGTIVEAGELDIVIALVNGDKIGEHEGITFVTKGSKIKITVSDDSGNNFMDVGTATIKDKNGTDLSSSEWTSESENGPWTATVDIPENTNIEGVYVTVKDSRDKEIKKEDATVYRVDTEIPKIEISLTSESEPKSVDGKQYYDAKVIYEITVTDEFLTEQNGSLTINYSIDGEEQTKTLTDYKEYKCEGGKCKYTYEITVVDGQTLSGLTVTAKDASGKENSNSVEDTIVVDEKAPVIFDPKISSEDEPSEYDQTDFYQKNVKFKITVADKFLYEKNGSLVLSYTINGKTSECDLSDWMKEENEENYTYSYTIELTDGECLTAVWVKAVDAYGHESVWEYVGNDIKVDYTAPVISVTCSENIIGSKMFNDKDFLLVEDNAEVQSYFLYFTTECSDDLDPDWMSANGWTEDIENNLWRYTASVENLGPYQTAMLEYQFSLVDVAENWHDSEIIIEFEQTDGSASQVLCLTQTNNIYSGNLYIDRRAPGSTSTDIPEVVLTPATNPVIVLENGKPLYNDEFSYDVTITDDSANGFDSGVKSVVWYIKDGDMDFLTTNACPGENTSGGDYTITVSLNDKNETNSATLYIEVEDHAGNTYTYSYSDFAVDNLAPRVVVSYDENEPTNEHFFNGPRVLTITVTDMHFDLEDTLVNGSSDGWEVVEGAQYKYQYQVAYEEDGEYSLEMTCKDLAENESEIDFTNNGENKAANSFIIDKTAPVVEITKEGGTYIQSSDNTDFYNNNVTYKVIVSDQYLSNANDEGQTQIANFSYTLEDDKGNKLTLPAGDNGWIYNEELNQYTYEFTVENGQVLTEMNLEVVDNAGNPVETILVTDSDNKTSFENKDGVWTYNGNAVAVDTSAPTVTVTKTIDSEKKYVQTYGDIDYYNGEVTYEIVVEDAFLNVNLGTANVVVSYLDGSSETIDLFAQIQEQAEEADSLQADLDCYVYSFTISDEKVLADIVINLVDNAGNYAEEVECNDNEGLTSFEAIESGAAYTYAGNDVVVDTVDPVASLSFSENVKSVYVNEKGVVYVQLVNPIIEGSSISSTASDATVTLTVTVTDNNLALDAENEFGVRNVRANDISGWTGETAVNTESTLTYTQSITVQPDATGLFAFELAAFDLAGNSLKTFKSNVTVGDTFYVVNVAEGVFGNVVSVDRRRPSSVMNDVDAPEIIITPIGADKTVTADGLDLFNGAFNYELTINDGEGENNSGIKFVSWTMVDPVGFVDVQAGSGEDNLSAYTTTKEYVIPVQLLAENGESNSVSLAITAVDNSGNVINYIKEFAVDNLAPRVSLDYSNDSVQNDVYFKDNRVITVSVTDINFNAETSFETTEVDGTDWTRDGDTYTKTFTYNTDGDYTFAMSTTDLANNITDTTENTTNLETNGHVALYAFTVDKTAPVIRVSFDPAVPVGTDDRFVQYFDRDRKVTVTITEHNFRASDVVSNLGAANALSAFQSYRDNHTATETFGEGNNYSVSVQYTDLAGNPAVAYRSETFSIDTHEPTITITKGEMTNSGLNIVSDDLLLGFTINDTQDNLKSFDVQVLFLSNSFEIVEVKGDAYFVKTGEGDRTTGYIDFTNIEKVKANDGIYTVRVTAQDYAGHVVELAPELVFSLNRFGSTFYTDDAFTLDFLKVGSDNIAYRNIVSQELVIKEINPNEVKQSADSEVEGSAITVSVNGNSFVLEKDIDYSVDAEEKGTGAGKWYEYTYRIDPSVFNDANGLVDGEYNIFFYNEDEAGNMNSNDSNEGSAIQADKDGVYTGKISFTLDHQAPVVTTIGIEDGERIVEAYKTVQINVVDNTPASIRVFINDIEVVLNAGGEGASNDEHWLAYDENTGNYVLNVADYDGRQTIRIEVVDAAGNNVVKEIKNFVLTEDILIQYIYNVPLVLTTILVLIAAVILIIVLLKKRKNNKEAAQV